MFASLWLLVAAACVTKSGHPGDPSVPLRNCGPPVTQVTVVHPTGWAAHWSHAKDLIAFNKKDPDGYFHIYLMDPSGANERRFGEGNPSFPALTAGSPNWHPSGKYIAFVAEKPTHPGSTADAAPGWGGYSDLWVATSDGAHVWQLTNVPADADHGTLIPIFSPDGTQILWTERTLSANIFNPVQAAGFWELKLADFVETADGPQIENVRTIQPGGADAFNESGGFALDSQSLLVTSDYLTQNFWSNQIYRYDPATGSTAALTQSGYNEHPRYAPDGRVMWMANTNVTNSGTEWWLMEADGSNPERLSYFNETGHVESQGQVWAGGVATENWAPDGSYFIGEVQTDLAQLTYRMLKVELTCTD
jgi:Tol biopolymer transport system component